jgi:uncharacterized protein YkwD
MWAAAVATGLVLVSCAGSEDGVNSRLAGQSSGMGGAAEGALGAQHDSSGGDLREGANGGGGLATGQATGQATRLATRQHGGGRQEAIQGEEAMALDIFERLNAERAARGLDQLQWNEDLAELAVEWSDVMAVTETFEHRHLDRELIETRLEGMMGVGENIFSATGPVPSGQAHLGWMKSEGHRANLLSPNWDLVGVGVHCAPDGRVYATQNFGRTIQPGPTVQVDPSPPEEPITRADPAGPGC